ncbi:MAG: EamA family transporter, partial [Gammaproteobacteria bacterium]|nr:EamA family transporter [Gammaproteobacteria bacterium]
TYGFVNPAVALLLGWWVLDERLGSLQIFGTAVILVGTILVNWSRTPLNNEKRESPPAA